MQQKVRVVVDIGGGDEQEYIADSVGVQGSILVLNINPNKQLLLNDWYNAECERIEVDVVEGDAEVLDSD